MSTSPFLVTIRAAFCAAFITLTLGCVESKKPALETFPVAGKLFVQGTPAAGAEVVLRPVTGEAGSDPWNLHGFPRGKVNDDGSFSISTAEVGDGAPPGEYVVLLSWPLPPPAASPGEEPRGEISEMNGPDRFQGALSDPRNSRWKVVVERKPANEIARIDL